MSEKRASGVGEWWKGLGQNGQAALTGSLIGGTTFGAVNMLREGKKNRFKNFLGGVAAGGLGGAAIGYGGSKLLNPSSKDPAKTVGSAASAVAGAVAKGPQKPAYTIPPPPAAGPAANDPPSDTAGRVERNLGGLQRRLVAGVGGAGLGAVAAPAIKTLGSVAGPNISRGWHTWTANSAKARADTFGKAVATAANQTNAAQYLAQEQAAKQQAIQAQRKAQLALNRTPTLGAAAKGSFKGPAGGKLGLLGALLGAGAGFSTAGKE